MLVAVLVRAQGSSGELLSVAGFAVFITRLGIKEQWFSVEFLQNSCIGPALSNGIGRDRVQLWLLETFTL